MSAAKTNLVTHFFSTLNKWLFNPSEESSCHSTWQTVGRPGRYRPLSLSIFFPPPQPCQISRTHLIQGGALIMQSHSSILPPSCAWALDTLQSFINKVLTLLLRCNVSAHVLTGDMFKMLCDDCRFEKKTTTTMWSPTREWKREFLV